VSRDHQQAAGPSDPPVSPVTDDGHA
jgi:hypothetical protein